MYEEWLERHDDDRYGKALRTRSVRWLMVLNKRGNNVNAEKLSLNNFRNFLLFHFKKAPLMIYIRTKNIAYLR